MAATFPITYTNTSPSGRSQNIPLNINVNTGSDAIARGIEQLGGAFEKMAQAKAAMDESTYRRQLNEITYNAWNGHRETTDPKVQEQIEQKWQQDWDAIAPDNDAVTMWKNSVLPQYAQTFANQRASLQAKINLDSFNLNKEKLIEMMDYPAIQKLVVDGRNTGVIATDAEAEELLIKAKRQIEKKTVFNTAMTKSLEDGLAYIKNSKLDIDDQKSLVSDFKFKKEAEIAQIEAAQEANFKNYLADIWNNNIPDLNILRQAYLDNKISEQQYNKLEEALAGPAKYDDPLAFKAINDAILDIPSTSQEEALKVYYENFNKLTPATQKAKLNEIYSDISSYKSGMEKNARSRMEELIREKDPLSGLFTDDKKQILAAAEADMLLDDAIKKARAEGKPLENRDILIKAIEIARTVIKKNGLDTKKANVFPEGIITHQIGIKGTSGVPGAEAWTGIPPVVYGTYNEEGKIILNQTGVQRLIDYANRKGLTISEMRKEAVKQGWIFPEGTLVSQTTPEQSEKHLVNNELLLKSAPDTALDPYWNKLDNSVKLKVWKAYRAGFSAEEIMQSEDLAGVMK